MYKAELLDYSITETSHEAITLLVTFPRCILPEFNTHRIFSKNTSSSRAIPIKRMLKNIKANPFKPLIWGKNQPGMQSRQELTGWRKFVAKSLWWVAVRQACFLANMLDKVGLHKQYTNRLLEPFGWVTMVFTTGSLSNFYALRDHPDAQPEIAMLAKTIKAEMRDKRPRLLKDGEWHMPFVKQEEKDTLEIKDQILLSVARCASNSYDTVEGRAMTLERASDLFTKLLGDIPIHASPSEHQLTPDVYEEVDVRPHGTKKKYEVEQRWKAPHLHGNMPGFIQFRKTLPNESL